MAGILVCDGTERSALAVVRSLGRAGHRVAVAASSVPALAGRSRWCATARAVPSPLTDAAGFRAAIAGLAAEHRADMVLPVTDASTQALVDAPGALGAVLLPMPTAEQFGRVCDKAAIAQAASRLGILVPRQVLAPDADAARVAAASLTFPLVLKPARSVAAGTRHGVVHAPAPESLESGLARLGHGAFPVLVQERVRGPGVGVFLLVWEGQVLAAFAHRRLREKPPAGGVSVYCESIPLEPALLVRSRALLGDGWNGVAMVEYKLDGVTGEPVLMEVNGRFWGSLQLAIDAGVDFPRLLVDAASGRTVTPVVDYRVGVRSRWFWGDVDHLLLRLLRSPASLSLPPEAPSRPRAVAAFVGAAFRASSDQVRRRDDPAPWRHESATWLRGLLR